MQRVSRIEAVLPFGHHVGQYRHSVEAYHAAGIVRSKFPHRIHTQIVGFVKQRFGQSIVELRIQNGKQRMQGAEGIPGGEHMID